MGNGRSVLCGAGFLWVVVGGGRSLLGGVGWWWNSVWVVVELFFEKMGDGEFVWVVIVGLVVVDGGGWWNKLV